MKCTWHYAGILLAILSWTSCKDLSTDPTQEGRYQYASYDSAGVLVVHGWFTLNIADSQSVSGEWHFAPVGNPRDIGPQTGDGTLVGGFHDGKLWIELNPQFRDNNLQLTGTLDGNRYSGVWAWISYVGITNTGTFEAVKQYGDAALMAK